VVEGYVEYNPNNHCFQLAHRVRALAQGVSRDELISQVARPILRDLCRELLLSVGLIMPVGGYLMLQVAMDGEAPLSPVHLPEGFQFPITFGAAGRLFLAHCPDEVRNELVEAAMASSPTYLTPHPPPTEAELDHIRQLGYAVSARPGAPEGVPADAIDNFLARLRQAAREVEAGLAGPCANLAAQAN
jgi:DNA-binding IclR family transcriptional regulator